MAKPTPSNRRPEPCIIVIFGASGDLTRRKLIPALFHLDLRGQLPDGLAIVGVSRTPMSDEDFREKLRPSAEKSGETFDADRWRRFASRVHYHAGDGIEADTYGPLTARLNALAEERGIATSAGGANLLFYLSVAPELYEPIVGQIGASGLVAEGRRWCSIDMANRPWQRIIIEKPFGRDLASAQSLNRALGRVFEEDAIFRIDHYLGKELVQNILVMRFANTIFEPVWNANFVDHVQLTAAETVGVGSRAANYYDTSGALRDMVQSHLLQVLALVAIEPPSAFDAAAIMREKIKLFGSAAPIDPEAASQSAAFGRYGAGGGEPAYSDERGVDPARKTETYAAIRLGFDNWRWAGVPFYLRSGKKMAAKLTEVVIQFKKPPTDMFRLAARGCEPAESNRIIINIAPSEGISVRIAGKVPGSGLRIDSAKLDLDYAEAFGGEPIEAYGPLILDAVLGDRTLYKHRDEVEASWGICQPLLEDQTIRNAIEEYPAGSWGPPSADALLARDGRRWHNPAPDEVR